MPASMVSTMVSTSKTQPPQVPPEACWSAAQSRESSGRLGCGLEVVGVGAAVELGVAPVRAEVVAVLADQVYRAFQGVAVNDDFY